MILWLTVADRPLCTPHVGLLNATNNAVLGAICANIGIHWIAHHNTSTRFNDGFELGLGAEVAVSTDKLHARGPMGINDLMTYKWVVLGEGQIRT